MPDPKLDPKDDQPLSPELERHLSDPAEKTEEVSGEHERARQYEAVPTEPDVTSEQQPT
jgi:hypothetical protein